MKTVLFAFALLGALLMNRAATAADVAVTATVTVAANPDSPLNEDMQTLGGEDVNLAEKYAGKVVLLVNVASFCGNTPQYEALEALHEKYADRGLAVVGVPCNQFHGQEPGTAAEIAEFCRTKYGVEFDLLAKVEVNGDGACPLYKYLTSKDRNPKFGGPISWNFEKFLFDRQGQVAARFAPKVKPDSREIIAAIETELAAAQR